VIETSSMWSEKAAVPLKFAPAR